MIVTREYLQELADEITNNDEWESGFRVSKKNQYYVFGDGEALVRLTQGEYMLINEEDMDLLRDYTWYCNGRGYAASKVGGVLHRIVLGRAYPSDKADTLEGDHINRCTLDNTRVKLRWATKSQNILNRGTQSNNTSGVKGVSWDSPLNRYKAYMAIQGKRRCKNFYVSKYGNKDKAFLAACLYRKQLELESGELC